MEGFEAKHSNKELLKYLAIHLQGSSCNNYQMKINYFYFPNLKGFWIRKKNNMSGYGSKTEGTKEIHVIGRCG